MDKLEAEAAKKKKGEIPEPVMREYLEKYEEISQKEKNRNRNEYRTCQICKDASNLTKSQKEWVHVQSIGRIRQVRVPVEKDSQGNDVTPSREAFMKKGSKRVPAPSAEEGAGKDIPCTALISDLILTAEELGSIKRMHWSTGSIMCWTTHSGKIAHLPKNPEIIWRSSENMHITSCAWQCTRQVSQI